MSPKKRNPHQYNLSPKDLTTSLSQNLLPSLIPPDINGPGSSPLIIISISEKLPRSPTFNLYFLCSRLPSRHESKFAPRVVSTFDVFNRPYLILRYILSYTDQPDFPLIITHMYVLAGAPDTTYRRITTNPGFQLQRTYYLTLIT